MENLCVIDSHFRIEGGSEILGCVNVFVGVVTLEVGCANYLPSGNACSAHHHGHGERPVVTTSSGIHLWRASEFAEANNECVLYGTTIMQVVHESCQPLVELGQGFIF